MRYSAALILIVFCGCAVKVTTPARAFVANKSTDEVFDFVVQAVVEAGFITSLANKEVGIITATKIGGMMNPKNTLISCKVQKTADGVLVDISSTLPGQMVSYGTTKKTIQELFKRLSVYLPEAELTIDGKAYTP